LAVDGANRPDMKMVKETLESIPVERPEPSAEERQNLCLDKGYAYDEVELNRSAVVLIVLLQFSGFLSFP
jgi:hypothetical protein